MTLRILAFNTVTDLCSVALMIDQDIYYHNIIAPRRHSEKILFMIDKLLVDAGIVLQSLDCIVFDQGPGSFIGIRIGIGVAQGLSLGADVPLVAVSSSEVLAQAGFRIFSMKQIITVINAHMGELYWSQYCQTIDNFWICKHALSIVNEKIAAQLVFSLEGKWALVGTGWNNYKKLESIINCSSTIVSKKIILPEAQDMLQLGVYNWKNKMFLCPHQIKPVYLRDNIFTNRKYV